MNVGILYFADEQHGLGHHYRCITLANALEDAQHTVYYFSNLQYRHKMYFQLRSDNKHDLFHILHQCKLDWLIIDTPDLPNKYVYRFRNEFNFQILYLNANQDYDNHDLDIIQGCLSGKYSGVEYIILRPMLDECKADTKNNSWFVFGGSADKTRLLESFDTAVDENAFLLGTEFSDPLLEIKGDKHMQIVPNDDTAFLALMSSCKRACISFGTIAWELVYYRIPTYAFSPTKEHLRWAQAMEKEGLIKAYPDVGLPDKYKIQEFLNEPFEIAENGLDLEGASRIVKLMEE